MTRLILCICVLVLPGCGTITIARYYGSNPKPPKVTYQPNRGWMKEVIRSYR